MPAAQVIVASQRMMEFGRIVIERLKADEVDGVVVVEAVAVLKIVTTNQAKT